MLNDLKADMWNGSHNDIIDNFLTNGHRLLVAYLDTINGLMLDYQVPHVPVQEITYFIKKDASGEVTPENFLVAVQYGTVMGGHIESLLRLMTGIYAPIFFENTSWPDSILDTTLKQKLIFNFFYYVTCYALVLLFKK